MQEIRELRRDKLTDIIGRAHERLQQILVDAGIDPAIARMIAAARLWQLLPTAVRQQVTAVESGISSRLSVLFGDVAKANAESLKDIPIE